MADADIYEQAQHFQRPIYAIGERVALPFYELKQEDGQWVVYGGINAMAKAPLAVIKSVGLTPIQELTDRYQLMVQMAYQKRA